MTEPKKRLIKKGPLTIGYLLSKMRPLHRFLPDRVRYNLPLGWNFDMISSFLRNGRKRVYIDVACDLKTPDDFEPRVETEPDLQLSKDEVKAFWDKGFAGPFTLIEPEAMTALGEHFWDLWDAPSTTYPPGTYEYIGSQTAASDGEFSNQEYATRGLNARDKHLQDPKMMDLFNHPAIVERVAQLLGPDLLLWRTQFFPKYPGNGGTGWHQASSYLNETMRVPTLDPPDIEQLFQLTVWVAVSESTLDNGCLRVVPGTHHRIRPMTIEDFDPEVHGDNKSDRFGTLVMRPEGGIDDADAVNLPMKPGQFVIFCERVFHGSRPNVTKDDGRLAMNARYVVPGVGLHNPLVLGEHGLSVTYLRINKLQLDRWRVVQSRGGNPGGRNADRVVPYTEGMVVNGG